MALEDAFQNLSEFFSSLDEEGEQELELSHNLVIVCPDCGKNVAFRKRCPKCGGDSWIPAGHAGGIFERMKVSRMRARITEDEEIEELSADEANEDDASSSRESGSI